MIRKITSLAVLLLVSSVVFAKADSISPNQNKAYRMAYCAATMSSTGKLKILYNQSSDSEAVGLIQAGYGLMLLSGMYSTPAYAFEVYDKTNKDLFEKLYSYSDGGVSRPKMAEFVLSYLVPKNEKCLPSVKDVVAHTAEINKYVKTNVAGKKMMDDLLERLKKEVQGGDEKLSDAKESVDTKKSVDAKRRLTQSLGNDDSELRNLKSPNVQHVEYLVSPNVNYPEAANGATGTTVVRALINVDGTVNEVTVNTKSGNAQLDRAALNAVKKAKFKPYRENGVAQAVYTLVPIAYAQPDDNNFASNNIVDKYEYQIKSHIKSAWRVPAGSSGVSATARFTLSPDGSIVNVVITQSSGNDGFDASIKALRSLNGIPVPDNQEVFNLVKVANIGFRVD